MEDNTTNTPEENIEPIETPEIEILVPEVLQTHSRIVEARTVENVMEDSYLRYSMSVIVVSCIIRITSDGLRAIM